MFIQRKYERTEHDDYVLNVQHHVQDFKEAVEVRTPDGKLVGWKIQNQYE